MQSDNKPLNIYKKKKTRKKDNFDCKQVDYPFILITNRAYLEIAQISYLSVISTVIRPITYNLTISITSRKIIPMRNRRKRRYLIFKIF